MRRSLPAWIFTGVLYALAVAQVVIAFFFWRTFGGEGWLESLVWPVIGCGLVILEIFALVVAADATERGETAKARALQFLFVCLASVNFLADIAAVSNMSAADEAQRSQTVLVREQLLERRAEIVAERASLKANLAADHLDLPPDAIAYQRDAAQARRARYIRPPTSLLRQIAQLESAHTTATRVAALEAERDQIDASLRAAPPTAAHHPQFETLQRIASWFGIDASVSDVRVATALLVALLLKAALAFGFWAATPHRRQPEPSADKGEDEARRVSPPEVIAPQPSPLPPTTTPARSAPIPDRARAAPHIELPPARPRKARSARKQPRPSLVTSELIDAIKKLEGKG
jgi:hypothetical protein